MPSLSLPRAISHSLEALRGLHTTVGRVTVVKWFLVHRVQQSPINK